MRKEFKVHILNDYGMEHANSIAQKFSELLDYVSSVSEASPELTLCSRKLQEACFYAKKSMAQKPENQKH